jgi:lysophospholipase L1-like esterase
MDSSSQKEVKEGNENKKGTGTPARAKAFLVIASIAVSLIFVEVILHYSIKRYYVIESLTPLETSDGFALSRAGSKFDEFYDHYSAKNKKISIVTVGDSFTNGGNVYRDHNYPTQLYRLLKRRVQITNLGLCEGGLIDSLVRIKDFIKKNPEGEHIFILLSGAADLIIPAELLSSNFHRAKIEAIKTVDMNKNLSEKKHEGLITVKLINSAWKKVKTLFARNNFYRGVIYQEVRKCFNGSLPEECLKKYFQSNKELLSRTEASRELLSSLVFFNRKRSDNYYTDVVRQLMLFISSNNKNIANIHLSYNIAAFSLLQSKISLREIHSFLKEVSTKEHDLLSTSDMLNTYSNFEVLLKTINKWINQSEKIDIERRKALEEIVSTIESSGHELILMSYPIAYKKINQITKTMAKKHNITYIDLQSLFEAQPRDHHLIDDWEHATPKGYQLIAEEVAKVLKNQFLE